MSQVTGSSSGSGASSDDVEKREFREDVQDFPWLVMFGVGIAAVGIIACFFCIRDKWRKMEEKVRLLSLVFSRVCAGVCACLTSTGCDCAGRDGASVSGEAAGTASAT